MRKHRREGRAAHSLRSSEGLVSQHARKRRLLRALPKPPAGARLASGQPKFCAELLVFEHFIGPIPEAPPRRSDIGPVLEFLQDPQVIERHDRGDVASVPMKDDAFASKTHQIERFSESLACLGRRETRTVP